VQPDGGEDQSGKVNAGDPVLFTVTVGGKSAGGGQHHHGQQHNYDRPAPPPPQQDASSQQPLQQEDHGEGGLMDKLKGFKDRFMH